MKHEKLRKKYRKWTSIFLVVFLISSAFSPAVFAESADSAEPPPLPLPLPSEEKKIDKYYWSIKNPIYGLPASWVKAIKEANNTSDESGVYGQYKQFEKYDDNAIDIVNNSLSDARIKAIDPTDPIIQKIAENYTFKGWVNKQYYSMDSIYLKDSIEENVDGEWTIYSDDFQAPRDPAIAENVKTPDYPFGPEGDFEWPFYVKAAKNLKESEPEKQIVKASNYQFVGVWEPKSKERVTVTFNKNLDGDRHKLTEEKFAKGNELGNGIVGIPENPTRDDGKAFLGWAKKTGDAIPTTVDGVQPNLETVINEDTDYYAIWEQDAPAVEKVRVNFYQNYQGAGHGKDTPPIKTAEIDKNSKIGVDNFPAQNPELAGYVFKGWAKGDDGASTGDDTQPTANTTISENTDYFAVWGVRVRFYRNYDPLPVGTVDPIKEVIMNPGDNLGDSNLAGAPSRDGYAFKGWADNKAANVAADQQPAQDTVINNNTDYYAVWKKQVTVNFYKNDNVTQDPLKTTKLDEGSLLVDNIADNPTRNDGYTFQGWAKKTGGIIPTKKDAEQPNANTVINEDTDYYAIWQKDQPNPPAAPGGGSAQPNSPSVSGSNKPNKLSSSHNGSNQSTATSTNIAEIFNINEHMHYVIGYPDGTVRPNRSISRAEVTSIYYRLLNDNKRDEIFTTNNKFSDVHLNYWYNKAVSSMIKGNYIYGYPDGTFGGDRAMTRAEFVALTARFLDKKSSNRTFSDVSDDHWAKEAISTGVAYGWLSGYEDGTFRPDQSITRAEVMTIINRLLDRGVDENGLKAVNYKKWIDNEKGQWYYYEVIEATHDHKYTGKRPNEVWSSLKIDHFYDYDKYERP